MSVVKIGTDTYAPGDRTEELSTTQLVGYMVGGNNLSELTSISEARTKLSVYSQAESDAAYAAKATTLAGYGITDAYTKTETDNKVATDIASLVDSAPATLDTLNELAAALGDDPNFATTVTNAIAAKQDPATTLAGYGITDAYTKTEVDAKTWDFDTDITGKPTTLAGYGITDAASSSHTHTFASLTSKPTTLAGYGITDALSNLSEDTTPSLGGDLTLGTNHIQITDAFASDHQASGLIIEDTVDVNTFGVGCALGVAADGNWESCDADLSGDFPCSGLALETGTGVKKILLFGIIRNDDWAGTITAGLPVYVSTADGDLTTTAPTGTGDQVQRVGVALSSTTILFAPSLDVFEV